MTDDQWKMREIAMMTYLNTEEFLRDFKSSNLRSPFRLAEPVFLNLIGMIAKDKSFAKKVNDNAVVLLMAAIDKKEIESLILMAETYLDG